MQACRNDTFVSPGFNDVERVALSRTYPVPLSNYWSAFLDVVWQYDMIVEITAAESRLSFIHGTSAPGSNARSTKFDYIDVLLVVYARERGSKGTGVFVAYVPPGSLEAEPIIELTDTGPKGMRRMFREAPREIAARIIADQFLGQVSTQILHKKRWNGRFSHPGTSSE
jgi:hypothetical protein